VGWLERVTMCEIAFYTRNKGANPRTAHQRGDPIEVLENGADWGTEVDKRAHLAKYGNLDNWRGNYVIVQITDLTVAKAKTYLVPHDRDATAVDPEFTAPDIADRRVRVLRKRWGVFISELPNNFKNKLNTDGFAVVTVAQVRNYFRNKIDGTLISG